MSEEQNQKILLVDDDEDILTLLKYNLKKEGFEIQTAKNGKKGIKKAKEFLPELILLDVMMPEIDGIETCMELRKSSELDHTLICFLTARGEDYSQVVGYESGADDYITKPIKPRVLISKVRALLRRKKKVVGNQEARMPLNSSLQIDRERYVVRVEGKELNLPKKEFELLSLLYKDEGVVFNRETILSKVWGDDIIVGDRTIDVHIRKLREKIGEKYIRTIKGVGYKFVTN